MLSIQMWEWHHSWIVAFTLNVNHMFLYHTALNMLASSCTLDLKRRLMTPFERLSAVRSELTQTDMLLLSLLALVVSTSSAPPTTAKERPTPRETTDDLLFASHWLFCYNRIFTSTCSQTFFSSTCVLAVVLLMNCVLWQYWKHSVCSVRQYSL